MDRVVLLRTLPIGFVNRTRNHPFRGSKTSTTRSKSEVESVYNEYGSIRVIYIDLCPTNTGGQGRVIALVGRQAALCIERRPVIGAARGVPADCSVSSTQVYYPTTAKSDLNSFSDRLRLC
jgi:hypothetical protein